MMGAFLLGLAVGAIVTVISLGLCAIAADDEENDNNY